VSPKDLNLGILAHVDAGKTTLTERLLYEAGAIAELGSVDAGTTQTDFLALERQRGITIRSAVASFAIDDLHVNLIDTPGHPDFIAEVERVLSVLDGAILVVSAVEGVQPQSRVLMHALERLRVPTLVFVNKIDRAGADVDRVLREISERLGLEAVGMGAPRDLGTPAAGFTPFETEDPAFAARLAEVLAEHDERLLAAYLEDEARLSPEQLVEELGGQTSRALVYPVYFGSALTGAGVKALMGGVASLLPASVGDPDGRVAASVFKIERGAGGEKVAYVRMFSGTIRTRDRVELGSGAEGKATAIEVFERGPAVKRATVSAGDIGKLWGLDEIQVGDRLGGPGMGTVRHRFPPPTLEAAVAPREPADGARLRVALAQLAEQDPLIGVRRDDARQEILVWLYGTVQKEVIEATLASDYALEVEFREPTPIYVERPAGTGEAVEVLNTGTNPFRATIGLRVEPAPSGSGVDFRLDVDPRTVPLYLYKTHESFAEHMAEYVLGATQEGLLGWHVTDCVVTMTRCAYSVPDGPPSRRGPLSKPADFRLLTPIVLRQALERAGTVVCEPYLHVGLEVPTEAVGGVLATAARLGGAVETPSPRGELTVVETTMAAAGARELERQLPRLTRGEGVMETEFAGYEPVTGDPPTRARPD
jgi:ribosomal protection tetracycline resistance protein